MSCRCKLNFLRKATVFSSLKRREVDNLLPLASPLVAPTKVPTLTEEKRKNTIFCFCEKFQPISQVGVWALSN